MLKEPEGLETLAEYSEVSHIDPQFAKTVAALKPSVTGKAGQLGDLKGGFGREMMRIVIGSGHPFKEELLAQYVLQFGMAVALTRTKTLDTDLRPQEESELLLEIYKSWAAVNYLEKEALCKDKPFHLRIKHAADILTGKAITRIRLEKGVRFLEDYFSDHSNITYLRFLADSVNSLG